MKTKVMIIILSLLGLVWNVTDLTAATPQSDQHDLTQAKERVLALFADISTINLLNGLNLTKDQVSKLLALNEQAQEAREWIKSQAETYQEAFKEAEEALQALKTEIQKGTPAQGEIPHRAVQSEQKLKELRDQLHRQQAEELKKVEADLNRLLSPEQIKVIKDFTPCLIPPVNLRDPVRAGQASSNEGAIKHLRQLRQVSEAKWPPRRMEIAGRIVEQFSKHKYRLTEEEKKAEQERIMDVLDRIRKLSDVDFEMQKESLAEELKPEDRIAALHQELELRSPHPKQPRLSKAGQFLLDKRIIPILQERLGRGGN